MKFKVGDRVKRISGEFAGMKVGDIGTIEETHPDGHVKLKEYQNDWDKNHTIGNLKLVDLREIIKEIIKKERK